MIGKKLNRFKTHRAAAVALILLVAAALAGGCGVAQVAVEASREQAKDIRITKARGYDPEKVANYQTVAVFVRSVGEGGSGGFTGFGFGAVGGGAPEIFEAHLAAALTREGYDVLGAGDVERAASEDELERPTERILFRLSKKVGADAIIVGIAESGEQGKFGLFGVGGGTEKGIVSASLKLVDADSGRPAAIISADYEAPKKASEVIDALTPHLEAVLSGKAEEVREQQKGIY